MDSSNNNRPKIIGICADHAGYFVKEFLKTLLNAKGLACEDFGTYGTDSVDYPDFAHPMAIALEKGEIESGIACCGSGNGINIVMNKYQHIRSAICWTEELAVLARKHNDANVLSVPARFVTQNEAEKILNAFLNTEFEGGRHQLRIDKIIPSC